LDFKRECFTYKTKGQVKECVFYQPAKICEADSDAQGIGTSFIPTPVVQGQHSSNLSAGYMDVDTQLKASDLPFSKQQPAMRDAFISIAEASELYDDEMFVDKCAIL
jgi:hypothetical protein